MINLSSAGMSHHVDEKKMQIKSEIAQHVVDESDFNFVNMHFQNHLLYHIRQLGNHGNISSELPVKQGRHFKQRYQQSNSHKATYQILRTKARQMVFQYREIYTNNAQQRHENIMPLTNVPIKQMMNKP
jgi:hypothetical protein